VSDPRGKYLGGYIGFGLGYVVLVSIRSIINLLAGWQASRRIHHASMASLCLAPISFFDTTPIGRILNRFAKVGPSHSAYCESALFGLRHNFSTLLWQGAQFVTLDAFGLLVFRFALHLDVLVFVLSQLRSICSFWGHILVHDVHCCHQYTSTADWMWW